MAINYCGYDGTNTMMTGGCDGTTGDHYDGAKGYERSNTLDGYKGSNVAIADGYSGSNAMVTMDTRYDRSNPMATMSDGFDRSNPVAICRRSSPSPPPFLSPPTQTAVESGSQELGLLG